MGAIGLLSRTKYGSWQVDHFRMHPTTHVARISPPSNFRRYLLFVAPNLYRPWLCGVTLSYETGPLIRGIARFT